MILKHVDGECFSLQKLVIRAPAAGYTSPYVVSCQSCLRFLTTVRVRAGMIFVSMDNDNDELLKRTNYTVHYESEDNQCEDTSDDESFDFNFLESINDLGEPSFEEDHTSTRRTSSSVSMPWSNQDDQPRPPPPPPVDILEPNATFSHKDRKSKCVINFEPAMYAAGAPSCFVDSDADAALGDIFSPNFLRRPIRRTLTLVRDLDLPQSAWLIVCGRICRGIWLDWTTVLPGNYHAVAVICFI